MIEEFIKTHNLPNFRLKQFNQQFYKESIKNFGDLSTWPKDLRDKLATEVDFMDLELEKEYISKNKDTIKVLFRRKVDNQRIETVLMKHRDGRNTVCVSCMVGCPVNCTFCATGKMGFGGNLSAKEIVDQVMYFQRQLHEQDDKVTNIVFMGMGEPMLNLPEVEKSIEVFTNPDKLGMSSRRLTISTSGYVPQLKKLIDDGFKGRVAISLHAPNQELREKLMPVAKLFPLEKLIEALDDYVEITNKRISYEYVMIKDVNDLPEHANQLADLFEDRLAHINLIPYNPIAERDFQRTTNNHLREFTRILTKRKIHYTIRQTMGDDVNAACGQLADRANKKHQAKKISG
ncbi:23S rRNA (adenine(2503)-C(2))-methyltransferase RlmN [Candidatus Dojkabacteria bacterium]|uniref:Probable dual-specificity RNA methyltransferase RlmN n=1 Tax=Candidatus Dojkabacteria bacterium TaxID=2099670 RepID=A0A955L6A1_9BACT|nr:23S rRNA (adenine(2503)-C(2))-methyltransferase RlmN [Candidatus Dojkabacteria bacterium]